MRLEDRFDSADLSAVALAKEEGARLKYRWGDWTAKYAKKR